MARTGKSWRHSTQLGRTGPDRTGPDRIRLDSESSVSLPRLKPHADPSASTSFISDSCAIPHGAVRNVNSGWAKVALRSERKNASNLGHSTPRHATPHHAESSESYAQTEAGISVGFRVDQHQHQHQHQRRSALHTHAHAHAHALTHKYTPHLPNCSLHIKPTLICFALLDLHTPPPPSSKHCTNTRASKIPIFIG